MVTAGSIHHRDTEARREESAEIPRISSAEAAEKMRRMF